MKIEDTPFQFGNVAPIDKYRRNQPALDAVLGDLDLSFLDLLNSVAGGALLPEDDDNAILLQKTDAKKPAGTSGEKTESKSPPKLTLVHSAKSLPVEETPPTQVDKDMTLLKDDLTAADIQYLKQGVIPNLPILLGSVPIESVFPKDGESQISYKGFDVSPKLAELIEKGYKSGRPIRVELDTKSAVIMKIRNGQVSAEFVSSDKTMALVMQQELDDLRHRMAQKNLPVGTLETKYQNPGKNQRRDEDEQDTEKS